MVVHGIITTSSSPLDDHPFISSASKEEWRVGDRVIVHSLQKASHLNGHHGCIGGPPNATTGRYPVDFDLPGEASHRVMAKAANLKPEPYIPLKDDDEDRWSPFHLANVKDGILEEAEGRPLCLLLDAIRFLVGNVVHRDPNLQNGLADIEKLRHQGQSGLERIHHYMQSAWSYWDRHLVQDDDGGGEIRPSIYLLLLQFFEELPAVNDMALVNMPPEFHVARAALYHRTAVEGWDTRIHADFWVLNHHSVYKVFGLRNCLSQALKTFDNFNEDSDGDPVLLTVTLLPWYGRLIYDGTCTPAHGHEAPPEVAGEGLAEQLRQNVIIARQEGRVVEHIAQLHLDAAILEQQQQQQQQQREQDELQQQRDDGEEYHEEENCREQTPRHSQPPITRREFDLLQRLEDLPVASADEAIWCMRRVGYTEEDNPTHEGVIINGAALAGGVTIGPFACSALVPSAEDIFQALVCYCIDDDDNGSSNGGESDVDEQERKALPAVVLIDDLKCFERVQFLVENYTPDDFTLKALYYPPPTREETAAALMDHNGN
ncbi:expressed unknown protein [Seminavis robusta]|uniref:Uncharacterized protein n=1 Tax=Seminavis robusta TaxID=568900 RepID=A0A9N8DSD5_9STRA|nr:expressed unknown protein [Seminavis robusta]|eukprot:Sro336_g120340.1 n/a (545) ;mRNA; r:36217-37944